MERAAGRHEAFHDGVVDGRDADGGGTGAGKNRDRTGETLVIYTVVGAAAVDTLSLHDALPISTAADREGASVTRFGCAGIRRNNCDGGRGRRLVVVGD